MGSNISTSSFSWQFFFPGFVTPFSPFHHFCLPLPHFFMHLLLLLCLHHLLLHHLPPLPADAAGVQPLEERGRLGWLWLTLADSGLQRTGIVGTNEPQRPRVYLKPELYIVIRVWSDGGLLLVPNCTHVAPLCSPPVVRMEQEAQPRLNLPISPPVCDRLSACWLQTYYQSDRPLSPGAVQFMFGDGSSLKGLQDLWKKWHCNSFVSCNTFCDIIFFLSFLHHSVQL